MQLQIQKNIMIWAAQDFKTSIGLFLEAPVLLYFIVPVHNEQNPLSNNQNVFLFPCLDYEPYEAAYRPIQSFLTQTDATACARTCTASCKVMNTSQSLLWTREHVTCTRTDLHELVLALDTIWVDSGSRIKIWKGNRILEVLPSLTEPPSRPQATPYSAPVSSQLFLLSADLLSHSASFPLSLCPPPQAGGSLSAPGNVQGSFAAYDCNLAAQNFVSHFMTAIKQLTLLVHWFHTGLGCPWYICTRLRAQS